LGPVLTRRTMAAATITNAVAVNVQTALQSPIYTPPSIRSAIE
jgi:hypothetical protein